MIWRAWRGERWLATGWFWYLGTLLPTIGFIRVGFEVEADRFLYLPQIGLCIAVAWAVANAPVPRRTSSTNDQPRILQARLCGTAALVAVIALAAAAIRQAGYWRGGESLWNRTLACTEQEFHCSLQSR